MVGKSINVVSRSFLSMILADIVLRVGIYLYSNVEMNTYQRDAGRVCRDIP